MKKIFIVVSVLLMLCGCRGNNTETLTETVSEISENTIAETTANTVTVTEEKVTTSTTAETTTTTSDTAITEWEYMEGEEQLTAFLNHLQNGTNYWFEFGNPIDVYDFMDDFKIDGYSYKHRGSGVYDVTLTCSESTCDLFPNGDSYWIYSFNFDTLFISSEREMDFDVYTHAFRNRISDLEADESSDVYRAYRAAVDFSLYTGVFEADREWFDKYIETDLHGFLHAYRQAEFGDEVHTGDLSREVKKLYNITIDPEIYEESEIISCAGHGGCWLYDDFAGYDETDSEIKVRVDYYGDELYLFTAVQSEYTFSKNEDGTITLQQVEKIFDTGYAPARGSI